MNQKLYDEAINLEAEDASTFGDFPPIPEGTYLSKVIESKFEPTKAGAPMYTLTLEIVDGEYRGRRLWHRRPVMGPSGDKKGTLGFVKADTQALGLKPTKGKAGDVAKQIVRESLGRLVNARVGFGKGDYADRNEVKSLLPSDAIEVGKSEGTLLVREEEL